STHNGLRDLPIITMTYLGSKPTGSRSPALGPSDSAGHSYDIMGLHTHRL
ncbi:Hypothetical protein FKW44_005035, partial [Caligus rogercresseyi]